MPRITPYTTEGAAQLTGLTRERIRQLVDEGTLPRHPLSTGRVLLIRAADVEQFAFERAREARRQRFEESTFTTLPLSRIPVAAAPRPLLLETVERMEDPGPYVHVRVWGGEDEHRIVLLGAPGDQDADLLDSRTLHHTLDTLQGITAARGISLDLNRTALVELYRERISTLHVWALQGTWAHGKLPLRSEHDLRVTEGIQDLVFGDLERALGSQPVLYHRDAYTLANIEEYQRTNTQVPYPFDGERIRETASHWRAVRPLDGIAADAVRAMVYREGMKVLERGQHLAPESRDGDAVQEADWGLYPWPPQGSRVTAARVPTDFAQWLEQGPTGPPFDPTDHEAARTVKGALAELADEHDQYHPAALPGVLPAALWAMGRVRLHIEDVQWNPDPLEGVPGYPRHHARHYGTSVGDPIAEAYFASLDLTAELHDYERNHLLDRASSGITDAQFSRDRLGNPVLRGTTSYGHPEFVVRESTIPARLDAETRLRAGTMLSGDTPLFICTPDGDPLGPLPDPFRSPGFAFGYGGSGPGNALRAVRHALTTSQLPLRDDVHEQLLRAIDGAVRETDIHVADLIA